MPTQDPLDFEDDELRSMGIDPVEHRRLARENRIARARESLGKAEVRCHDFDELLGRLDGIWDDEFRHEVAERIQARNLTTEEGETLRDRLRMLDDQALQISHNARMRLDRLVAKLIRALPDSLRREYAYRDLTHRRKLRRQKALQTFQRGGIGEEYASRLWEGYKEHGDREFLHAIVRDDSAVTAIGPDRLLAELDEEYWEMRVIESLLRVSASSARERADSHPRKFTWAVGRSNAHDEIEAITQLARSNRSDARLLGLYAWAIGKLEACELMPLARALIDDLDEQTPDSSS